MSPKVFVSHASEDKDRFVVDFAKRLRERGIDAWLDKWEMFPGDSLVDKIFEEGIKEAAAVIIVLSKASVQKPWVREELNAAFVARINKGSKLIPVVIDDCEVPAALSSTLWIHIVDLSSYDAALDRIVASILGTTDKPPLGPLPSYTNSLLKSIGGLSTLDSTVLQMSGEAAIDTGHSIVNPEAVFKKNGDWIFPESQLEESLEILEEKGYIQARKTIGGGLHSYQITTYGFEVYANECVHDYQHKVKQVISAVVNQEASDNLAIAESLGEKVFIVDHVLDLLEGKGLIRQAKALGGTCMIVSVAASLRRMLNQ